MHSKMVSLLKSEFIFIVFLKLLITCSSHRLLWDDFISLIFFLIYIYLKEFVFIEYINALTYIVFFNIFIAGLSFCTNLGFFDIFAYNFLRTRNYLNKYRDENISRLNGTYDYTKSKEFKRKSNKFVPFTYLFVSLLFLIPLIILYIIYRVNIV